MTLFLDKLFVYNLKKSSWNRIYPKRREMRTLPSREERHLMIGRDERCCHSHWLGATTAGKRKAGFSSGSPWKSGLSQPVTLCFEPPTVWETESLLSSHAQKYIINCGKTHRKWNVFRKCQKWWNRELIYCWGGGLANQGTTPCLLETSGLNSIDEAGRCSPWTTRFRLKPSAIRHFV